MQKPDGGDDNEENGELKHNIPFQKRGARQVTDADYEYYDRIFVMDWANLRDMKRRFGDEKGKILMLHIIE